MNTQRFKLIHLILIPLISAVAWAQPKVSAPEYTMTILTQWSQESVKFEPAAKGAGHIAFEDGRGGRVAKAFVAKDYADWLKRFRDLEKRAARASGRCAAKIRVTVRADKPYVICFDKRPEAERELTRSWRGLRAEVVKRTGKRK